MLTAFRFFDLLIIASSSGAVVVQRVCVDEPFLIRLGEFPVRNCVFRHICVSWRSLRTLAFLLCGSGSLGLQHGGRKSRRDT